MSRSFWLITLLSIGLMVSLMANGVQYNRGKELEAEVNQLQKKDQVSRTAHTFVELLMNGSDAEEGEGKLKEITTKQVQKRLFDAKADPTDLEQNIEIEGIHLEHHSKEEAKVNVIFLAHLEDPDIPSSEYRLRLKMKWEKNRWKIADYQFHTG